MTDANDTWRMIDLPQRAAGAYWLGGVRRGVGFFLPRRPNFFHRWMVRLVFGWVWSDGDAQ